MKKISYQHIITIILLSIINLGCSDSEKASIVETPTIIEYDFSNFSFVTKGIQYSELIGEWKLINAKYECALGELEHIEDNYSLEESDKKMIFGTSTIEKILFHWVPKYGAGIYSKTINEEVVEITMVPADGHDIMILQISYTNEILTLCYKSDWLEIDEKRYEGRVFETYRK